MRTDAKFTTIRMSRGSLWTHRVPGSPGNLFPAGESHCVFYDRAGGVVATLDGEVTPSQVLYEIEPANHAVIPHGSGFELFVTPDDTGVPQMVEWGQTVRGDVKFPLAPPVDVSDTALLFEDSFNRTLLGPKWIIKYGRPTLTAGGVCADLEFFNLSEAAAALFLAPLNGGDLTINATFAVPGNGTATIAFSSDYGMTSWVGFQVEKASTSKVHIVKGTGPVTMSDATTAVTSTTVDADNFVIKYNSQTDTVSVYKNNSTTALISWTDTGHTVQHGLGYAYLGFSCRSAALFSTGPRVTEWSAKDGI